MNVNHWRNGGVNFYLIFYDLNDKELLRVPYTDNKDAYITGIYKESVEEYPDIPDKFFSTLEERENKEKLIEEERQRLNAARSLANSKFKEITNIIENVDNDRLIFKELSSSDTNSVRKRLMQQLKFKYSWGGGGSKTRRSKKYAKRRTMYRKRDTR